MASPRQELLRLLASKSFRLGQFKLSSGGTSDYYIDWSSMRFGIGYGGLKRLAA
jgi:orotate phosphoribosyltransferase